MNGALLLVEITNQGAQGKQEADQLTVVLGRSQTEKTQKIVWNPKGMLNFWNQSLQDEVKVIIRTELRPKSVSFYTLKNLSLQTDYKGCSPVCSNLTV